ncbi:hypothetical protein [Aquisphaera insulae]|uniref:hypothetical protein n=1 Tax=Aquisphaera insulae TaxID=2712864 RepID=UPI0013EA9469|nr:hypothetical protein [Aquisphaera insulae]
MTAPLETTDPQGKPAPWLRAICLSYRAAVSSMLLYAIGVHLWAHLGHFDSQSGLYLLAQAEVLMLLGNLAAVVVGVGGCMCLLSFRVDPPEPFVRWTMVAMIQFGTFLLLDFSFRPR